MIIRNWLMGGIVLFALFGLGSYLLNNPLGLFKQVLMIGIVMAVIFVVYRVWIGRVGNKHSSKAFVKAARLSKKRKQQLGKTSNSQARKKPLRKRSAAHLTVIEGKKNKKKDRAIF